MSELESLFSAATSTTSDGNSGGKSGRRATGPKSEKVQLVSSMLYPFRFKYKCEFCYNWFCFPMGSSSRIQSRMKMHQSLIELFVQIEHYSMFAQSQ